MKKITYLLLSLLFLTLLSCGLKNRMALDRGTPVISGSPILVLNP